jgi:hypothetical protein
LFLLLLFFYFFFFFNPSRASTFSFNLTWSVPKKELVAQVKAIKRQWIGDPIRASDYPFGGCQHSSVLIPALLSQSRPVYQMVCSLIVLWIGYMCFQFYFVWISLNFRLLLICIFSFYVFRC